MLDLTPLDESLEPLEIASRDVRGIRFPTQMDDRDGRTTPRDGAAAAEELKQHVKDTIGVTAEVSAMEPGSIERSMGEMRRTVDHPPR